MINERVRLSIGGTPGLRIFQAVFGLVFAAIGATFVILPLAADGVLSRLTGSADECTLPTDLSGEEVSSFPADCFDQAGGWDPGGWDFGGWDLGGGLGPARFIGLCGVPFVLIGLYLALSGLRRAAWLDGTRANVRGAFGTRTVDLATAEITAGATTVSREHGTGPDRTFRLPTLVARDPGTGRRITVPLHGAGTEQLPPHELRALADAMTRDRPTAGRDADVHTIARQLRTMADNPLGL